MSDSSAYNVLFLCTGNSARSILAEVLLGDLGKGHFRGFSAGSFPKREVHPLALELLETKRLPVKGLRSKSWDEFARPGAPHLDFVFTVCDSAAGEACPIWPGRPVRAHWGIPDPAATVGNKEERRRAFLTAYNQLSMRLSLFVNLPINTLDQITLREKLRDIGKEQS